MADGLGPDDRAGQVTELYRRYREALQRVRASADDPEALEAATAEALALGAEIDALAEGDSDTIHLDASEPEPSEPPTASR